MTHALYMERAEKWQDLQYTKENKFRTKNPGQPLPASNKESTDSQWAAAFSVCGKSILSELPGFDMVDDTLLDMMHIGSGQLGTHLIPMMTKDRIKQYGAGSSAALAQAKADADKLEKLRAKVRELDVYPPETLLTPQVSNAIHLAKSNKEELKLLIKERLETRQRLSDHHDRFHISDAQCRMIQRTYYADIQAPVGIAQLSKAPLTSSGEMTAHHWLKFVQVYGKYLFLEYFGRSDNELRGGVVGAHPDTPDGRTNTTLALQNPNPLNPALQPLCQILDILELCFRSHATRQVKIDTARKIRECAATYEERMPAIEQAIITHLLFFHMPATIKRWGPARGFWCFPFERYVHRSRVSCIVRASVGVSLTHRFSLSLPPIRFIGYLSNTIKSRKHPEANLANRWLLSVATNDWSKHTWNEGEEEAEADADTPAAAEQPGGPVHSIMDEQRVIWPLRTPQNSRLSKKNGKSLDHARARQLIPMLGKEVCDRFPRLNASYEIVDFTHAVQVGRITYKPGCKEDQSRQVGKTRCSWFRIRKKHVPHWTAILDRENHARRLEWYDPDGFLFGRIVKFARLHVPAWQMEFFHLAEVNLYESIQKEKFTGYDVIDTTQPLMVRDVHGESRDRERLAYVQCKHLHSSIAVAPVHDMSRFQHPPDFGPNQRRTMLDEDSKLFYILPIQT